MLSSTDIVKLTIEMCLKKHWDRIVMTKTSLPLWEKVSYGFGDTACNIYFQIVIVYLMQFYTDVFGISAAAAGTMFLVVRIFDGFTDPMMGAIADRTDSRWGKYRPYMLSLIHI